MSGKTADTGAKRRGNAARLRANGWNTSAIQLPVWQLLALGAVTVGACDIVWMIRRESALRVLGAPVAVKAELTYAAAGCVVLLLALPALGHASIWLVLLTLLPRYWGYRTLRVLQWRAEKQLGQPFELSWPMLILFQSLYVQHRMNALVELEQRLGERDGRGEGSDDEGIRAWIEDKVFWDLVAHIDRHALSAGDHDAATAPLQRALFKLAPAEIESFAETLARKLHAFDGPRFVEAAGPVNGTAKGFLWARCYVVAQGQETYRAVLASPARMPQTKAERCAPLLEVAGAAYVQATGEGWTFQPSVSVRRGSNMALWGDAAQTAALTSSASGRRSRQVSPPDR